MVPPTQKGVPDPNFENEWISSFPVRDQLTRVFEGPVKSNCFKFGKRKKKKEKNERIISWKKKSKKGGN